MCKVYTGYCGTSEIGHGLCACTVDNLHLIQQQPDPEVISFFMPNSAEHESLNAYKYKKNIKKSSLFKAQISL